MAAGLLEALRAQFVNKIADFDILRLIYYRRLTQIWQKKDKKFLYISVSCENNLNLGQRNLPNLVKMCSNEYIS